VKTLRFLLAVLFVLGCVTLVWGQQRTTTEQPKKSEQPMKGTWTEKGSTLTAEVVSVDTAASTLTVKDKSGKSETFKIDPKATFKKSGKVVALKELTAGEKVRVGYKTEAGERVATWISSGIPHQKKEGMPKK